MKNEFYWFEMSASCPDHFRQVQTYHFSFTCKAEDGTNLDKNPVTNKLKTSAEISNRLQSYCLTVESLNHKIVMVGKDL